MGESLDGVVDRGALPLDRRPLVLGGANGLFGVAGPLGYMRGCAWPASPGPAAWWTMACPAPKASPQESRARAS
jgi:hypothetical protein